jgi:hypothetical protein
MTGLHALWIPIVLSAVITFVVSSVIHMASPWHKGDYPKMPNEDAVRDALRPFAIPPGDYMVPRPASMDDMKSPAFAAKLKEGPVMVVTVMRNGMTPMGRNLGLWFVYLLAVAAFAAYVASRTLPPGAEYMHVFRVVAVTAFLGFAAALWQMFIWYQRAWNITIKATIDGVIYACLTAGTFGWLWPR